MMMNGCQQLYVTGEGQLLEVVRFILLNWIMVSKILLKSHYFHNMYMIDPHVTKVVGFKVLGVE